MKRLLNFIIVLLTIFICFILQSSVFARLSVSGIRPNLMLTVSVAFGFLMGEKKGLFIGLVCGLLCDIMFSPLMGIEGAILAFTGYLSGKFSRLLYAEDLVFPVFLVCMSDLVYGFLNFILLFMMRNRLFFREFLIHIMLPEMVYTGIVAIPLIGLIWLIYDKFMRIRHARTATDLSDSVFRRT